MKIKNVINGTVNAGKNVTKGVVGGAGAAICLTGVAAISCGELVSKGVRDAIAFPGVVMGIAGAKMMEYGFNEKFIKENKNEVKEVEA